MSPLRVDVIYFRIVGLHFQKFNLNYCSVRFLHFMKCKFLTQGQFRRTWLQSCGPGEGVHQDCSSNRGGWVPGKYKYCVDLFVTMTTSTICMLKKNNFLHVSENAIHNKINTYKMRRRSRGVNSNSQQVKVRTWFEIKCYAHRKHERSELALIWHWKKLIWMTLTFFLECNFI